MLSEKIVFFVTFETKLNSEQFIPKWDGFIRSVNSGAEVILHESKKNNLFNYIAEHRGNSEEFEFIFTKSAKLTRLKEVEIKTKLAGGYSMLSEENSKKAVIGQSKIFAFLNNQDAQLLLYKQIPVPNKLNIYEAYYENCEYAYILEFFVADQYVSALVEQLHLNGAAEVGIYKVCLLSSNQLHSV